MKVLGRPRSNPVVIRHEARKYNHAVLAVCLCHMGATMWLVGPSARGGATHHTTNLNRYFLKREAAKGERGLYRANESAEHLTRGDDLSSMSAQMSNACTTFQIRE